MSNKAFERAVVNSLPDAHAAMFPPETLAKIRQIAAAGPRPEPKPEPTTASGQPIAGNWRVRLLSAVLGKGQTPDELSPDETRAWFSINGRSCRLHQATDPVKGFAALIGDLLRLSPEGWCIERWSTKIARMTLQEFDAATAKLETTRDKKPDPKAMLSPRDLSLRFNLTLEPLRKRLERWRKRNAAANGTNWMENTEASSRDARFVYRVGAIQSVIDELRSVQQSSSK